MTRITEGYKNWTFNNSVTICNEPDVKFVSYWPAVLSGKKQKTYFYRTEKGLNRKVEELTRHFYNPVKETK